MLKFYQESFDHCIILHGNDPLRPGRGLKGWMNGFECFFECVLNHTEATENGKPSPQKLIELARAGLGTLNEWLPAVTAGIEFCNKQMISNMSAINESLKDDVIDGKTVCPTTAAFLFDCMTSYELRNCPATYFNDTEECKDLQKHFVQCPAPLLN
jgi:hypothetical protein